MKRSKQRSTQTRIGERYGRLSIIDVRSKSNGSLALVVCDCGRERWMDGQSVYRGKSTSCGCYQRESASRLLTRHGMSGTKIHKIWLGVVQRTTDPTAPYFKRGISICDRWRLFENFYADMGAGYSKGLTIERIDNSLGYEPKNCRWVTRSEQGLNRTNNRLLELNGERFPLSVWSRKSGVSASTIHYRLKSGWDIRAAIFEPAHHQDA